MNNKIQEKILDEIQHLAGIGYWIWDFKTNSFEWSNEAQKLFGYNDIITYESFLKKIHPEDRKKVKKAIQKTIEDTIPHCIEYRVCVDNEIKYIEENAKALYENGIPFCIIGTVNDKTLEKQHQRIEKHFGKILQLSFEEIYIFNARTFLFETVSKGSLINLGYSPREIKKLRPWDIKPLFTEKQFKDFTRPLKEGKINLLKFETLHQRKDNSVYYVDIRLQYIDSPEPMFIALVRDITEQHEYEEELRILALRDPGTNLYNKRFFLEELEMTINKSQRNNTGFGLIMIDLDDFSEVNNIYGHLVGDQLIAEIANRIQNVFPRRDDVVARYGGDEFAIICSNVGEEILKYKADMLVKEIAKPFYVNDEQVPHSASIGVCYCWNGKKISSSEEILNKADIAMYRAKSAGKNQYHFFEDF